MLDQYCQSDAGDTGADKPQRRKRRGAFGEAASNFHHSKRDSALNDRKTQQIGINWRGLGAIYRFPERIAVQREQKA